MHVVGKKKKWKANKFQKLCYYQCDRDFSCNSEDIGTRDNSRANVLEGGFDFIDHFEPVKRVKVLESLLFTLYSIRRSSIQ